jgi:16S rRNA (adenine1518-N6/adenine1519-N6)-dimethyltransferase
MVQKEVADRLVAAPGSKVYGVPSVKLAWYARGPPGRRVPPRCSGRCPTWTPGWWRSTAAAAGGRAAGAVFAVVDAAFAQRRKTLRAALAGWAGGPAGPRRCGPRPGSTPGTRRVAVRGQFAAIAAAAQLSGSGGKLSASASSAEEVDS